MTLAQLLLFLPAAAIVATSPGANNLPAFANGGRRGFWPAVVALSGRCITFVLMIAMVIIGLGALLEASELAFQIIKWAGVLYLACLGARMMIARDDIQEPGAELASSASAYILARRAFIVAMTNPKAVLLFTALVPQFIVSGAGASYTTRLVALGAICIAVELVAAMGWALAGNLIRAMRPSARRLLFLSRMTGAMMLGAAGMLATARRSQGSKRRCLLLLFKIDQSA